MNGEYVHLTLFRLRQAGWMVAVHNDYRLNGELFTFWLFTRDTRCAKGEGSSDEEAIRQVEIEIERQRVEEERRNLPTDKQDPGCVKCGALSNIDTSIPLWRCSQCRGEICRNCTLQIPGSQTYYEETLCSLECWERAGRPDE